MKRIAVIVTAIIVCLAPHLVSAEEASEPNPKVKLLKYRDWTHVKSMVIFDSAHPLHGAFGGIHHVYANPKALKAMKAGESYPDGSHLVFVLYDIKNADGAYVATDKKITAIMSKKSEKYPETGGWAFQAWTPDGKAAVTDGGASCFACHKNGAAGSDFVFSKFEE